MTYSNVTLPVRLTSQDAKRFWEKVNLPASPDECWIWEGAVNNKGYGVFRHDGGTVKAHRLSYSLRHGQLPPELVLDHVKGRCGSTLCINPDHLDPVTQEENCKRGAKYKGPHGPCKRNHAPNWRVRKRTPYGTSRVCVTCEAELRKARNN